MKPAMLLVTDTNIWIDLENGKVLELIFELPYHFITTDFAADELDPTLWAILDALGVEAYGLTSEQIMDIYALNQNYHSVSTTDFSCLVLARDLPAVLLSGDKPLRMLAEEQSIEVHGVLWLLDVLVDHHILPSLQACHALKNMLAYNARLPKSPCNKRLRKWSADV